MSDMKSTMPLALAKEVAKKRDLLLDMGEENYQAFVSAMHKVEFEAGTFLFDKGEPTKNVYIVEKGSLVKKFADRDEELTEGDANGLLHFYQEDSTSYQLTVGKKGATVWTMNSEDFKELLRDKPDLSFAFIRWLTRRLRLQIDLIRSVQSLVPHEDDGEEEKVRIAFFDSKEYMRVAFEQVNTQQSHDFDITYFDFPLSAGTARLARGHKVVCCFVSDKVDADAIARLAQEGVQLIAMRCAGYNNVDLAACQAASIDVTRVPAYSPYAVAEHAVTLMLALNRKVHKAYSRTREYNFDISGLVGFDMHGKTVGVMGTGKIGRCTVDILLGFGCKVIAHDLFENDEMKAKGVTYVTKEELLLNSDILTLHAPLLPSTRHWLDADALKLVKPHVLIINTSRGGLLDSSALLDAVLDGRIGGAGLDVLEEETGLFFSDHSKMGMRDSNLARLLGAPNVVVTSHQAFLTEDALSNIAGSTLASVSEFQKGLRGEQLTNFVKQEY